MVISSNALFHFTRSMDDLVGILKDDFIPRFCLENYSNLFSYTGNELIMAFPMVCFCDLPISQLRGHMDYYGSYGLGMKKHWGVKNGISPVMYMQPGSSTAVYLKGLFEYFDNEAAVNDAGIYRKYLRSIIRQIKLYEGSVGKDGRQVIKRFYDEREWRWVPYVLENGDSDLLSLAGDAYNDPQKRRQAEERLRGSVRLSFGPDDIDYIIVAQEKEIFNVIEAVEKFEQRYDEKTIKILTTRIISAEQIRSDF